MDNFIEWILKQDSVEILYTQDALDRDTYRQKSKGMVKTFTK